jgi:hypothetical protein
MRLRPRTLVIAAIALFTGTGLAVWLIARDEAPPDISDLPEIRPAVSDTENAFLGLLVVAQTLAERAKNDTELNAALDSSSLAKERDPQQLAHVLASTTDLIEPWRKAVALPRALAPAYRAANHPPFETGQVHKLGRLVALWCATPSQTNGVRLAEALRAAHHVTESYDTLIVYLTGLASTNLTLAELTESIKDTPPDAPLARELIRAIEAVRLSPDALAAILHNEAHFALKNAANDDLDEYIEGMAVVGIPSPPAGATWFYKPNQSARWEIEDLRAGLARLETLPVSKLAWPKPDRGSASILFGLPHPDNAFGDITQKIPLSTFLRSSAFARS